MRRTGLALAALGGLASVGFGAFGAHGAASDEAADWLQTGATYGLAHALAVFAAGSVGGKGSGAAAALFLVGIVLFCGALWAMALGGPRLLGAVAPLGGLSFMTGWALLAWAALSKARTDAA